MSAKKKRQSRRRSTRQPPLALLRAAIRHALPPEQVAFIDAVELAASQLTDLSDPRVVEFHRHADPLLAAARGEGSIGPELAGHVEALMRYLLAGHFGGSGYEGQA